MNNNLPTTPDKSGGPQAHRSTKVARIREWAKAQPAPSPTLTESEAAELAAHEKIIAAGLQTFVEVGNALAAVREGKLFRATHSTFSDYCADRWNISDRQGRRLMAAAEVAELTGPMGPVSERVARELAPLREDPAQITEVWQEAQRRAGGGAPTADHVIAAREVTERRDGESRAPRVIRDRVERRTEAPLEDPTRVVRIDPLVAVPTDFAVLTDTAAQALVLARKARDLWRYGALDRTPADVRANLAAQHRRIAELHLLAAELAEASDIVTVIDNIIDSQPREQG